MAGCTVLFVPQAVSKQQCETFASTPRLHTRLVLHNQDLSLMTSGSRHCADVIGVGAIAPGLIGDDPAFSTNETFFQLFFHIKATDCFSVRAKDFLAFNANQKRYQVVVSKPREGMSNTTKYRDQRVGEVGVGFAYERVKHNMLFVDAKYN